MQHEHKEFEPGDLVRLRTGWTALCVVKVADSWVTAAYSPSALREYEVMGLAGNSIKTRLQEDFVLWNPADKMPGTPNNRFEDQEIKPMASRRTTLYRITLPEGEIFGHFIADDSDGQWVMKRDNGQFLSVPPAACQKVLPYSVKLRLLGHNNCSLHKDFWAEKRWGLAVGDLVWLEAEGQLAMVIEIDTKSERADAYLAGVKLQGSRLEKAE